MAGPWEKYAQPDQTTQGPWSKYTAPVTTPQAQPKPTFMQKATLASNKLSDMKSAAKMGVGQGLSLGFMDELAGAGAAIVPGGKGYTEARDDVRGVVNQTKERNPKSFLAGELGGGVATGGVGGARMAGLKGSAALGAGYGMGTADNGLKDRLQGAAIGGGLGVGMHLGANQLGKGLGKLLQKRPQANQAIPELDDLKSVKDAAYRRLDQAGVRYTRDQSDEIIEGIKGQLPLDGPTGRTTGPAPDIVRRLGLVSDDGITASQLEDLRGMAAPNSMNATPTELRDAGIVRSNIDDFMGGITPKIGDNAAQLTQQARSDAGRYIRSRNLQELLENAKTQASSNKVPDPLHNQRKAVKSILTNKGKRAGYSAEEQEAMRRFVKGSPFERTARQVGKLGSGNIVGTSIGAVAGNAVMPGAGMFALPAAAAGLRKVGERSTQNSLDDLVRLVRTGQSVAPQPTAASQAVQNPELQALLAQMGVIAAQ